MSAIHEEASNPYAKIMHVTKWRILRGVILVLVMSAGAALLFNYLSGKPLFQFSASSFLLVTFSTLFSVWYLLGSVLEKLAQRIAEKQELIREITASLKQRVGERTAELELTSKELEKSLQVKSEFLATMSHEIRTPMNGVLGMSQLLSETELSEKQRRYVGIVNASGKSLLEVLNNVLDFSKIEAGKMEVENIPFDLENLIDECVSVFSLKALEKKVVLFSGLDADVPRICKGDPTRLRQVLMNLLSNAIKFTFNGEVSVRVSSYTILDEATKTGLKIEVRDEGIGIAKSQQTTLFEAFSQTDISTARKYGGTGLGLVICKQLTKLMAGEIQVTSELEKGTSFTILLSVDTLTQQESQPYASNESSLSGATVLVIDSENAAELICQQLKFWGARALRATSYYAANELLRSEAGRGINQIIAATSLEDGNAVEFINNVRKVHPEQAVQAMITAPISLDSMDPPDGIFKVMERPIASATLHDTISSALQCAPVVPESVNENPIRESFSDVKALVAEDNQVNQLVIKGILKKFKMTPVIVEDGKDALKALSCDDNDFDLVLMDCEMPVMDGWEATEQIRQFEEQVSTESPVKIVALSAHVIEEPQRRALESGMDKFVAKPVDIDSVEKILHEYFPRRDEGTHKRSAL